MDYLNKLPNELLLMIIAQLDVQSRLVLNATNRRLRSLNLCIPIFYMRMGEVFPYMVNQDNRIKEKNINRLQLNLKKFPGIKYLSFDEGIKIHTKGQRIKYGIQYTRWLHARHMNRNVSPFLKKLNNKKNMNLKAIQCLELSSCILSGKIDSYLLDECVNLKYFVINAKYEDIEFDKSFADSPTLENLKLLKINGRLRNQEYFKKKILPKCLNLSYLQVPYNLGHVLEMNLRQSVLNTFLQCKNLTFLEFTYSLKFQTYVLFLKSLPLLDHFEFELETDEIIEEEPFKHTNLKCMKLSDKWAINGIQLIIRTYKAVFKTVPNLKSLTIDRIEITDDLMQNITTILPWVEYLSLQFSYTKFTTTGFKLLTTGCANLQICHFYFLDSILDNSLMYLLQEFIKNHKMLKILNLSMHKYEFDALNMLRQTKKDCRVFHFSHGLSSYELPSKYYPIKNFILNKIKK